MKNLFQYIERLLMRNDYAIVPNFGGFVVQNQSAVVEENCIAPPRATVAFNTLLQASDGLLAVEVAKSEGITYREAVAEIEQTVAEIREKLQKNEKIQAENLGKLCLINGNIIFSPENKLDFLPANFGLNELHFSRRNKYKTLINSDLTIRIPFKRTSHYAAAAILIFALLFISPAIFDKRQQQANLFDFSFEQVNELTFENDSIFEKNEIKNNNENTDIQAVETSNTSTCYVIVGCFQKEFTAQRYCSQLQNNSFSNACILPSTNNFKVAIAAFNNEEEAVKYAKFLRNNVAEMEEAWVMKN